MNYQIEDNIDIPPRKIKRRKPLKYPWDKLNPGESFFIETEKSTAIYLNGANAWAMRNGVQAEFTTRSVEEDGKKGVRIWRTK